MRAGPSVPGMTTSPNPSPSGAAPDSDPSTPRLRLIPSEGTWHSAISLTAPGALVAHPLATRLPGMTETERAALYQDVVARGITTPIEATSHGVILDGHARWQVATELGIAGVPVRIVDPDDEASFILARAVGRRNLSASQRAALAVECEQYRIDCDAGRERKLANLRSDPDVAELPHRRLRSRERAAVR